MNDPATVVGAVLQAAGFDPRHCWRWRATRR